MPDGRLYWHLIWTGEDGDRQEALLDVWDNARLFRGRTRPGKQVIPRGKDCAPQLGGDAPAVPDLRYPAEYEIPGVPHYFQQTGFNCGPASLQMVFDYWGEAIPQTAIAQAGDTQSSYGTNRTNMRRAIHFSHLSAAIQNPDLHGYDERPIGYAGPDCMWSYPNSSDPDFTTRYEDLKELISHDHPVILLTWYSEYHTAAHYRVLKGYSDPLDLFVVHDPWYTPPYMGPDVCFNQAFLVDDLWTYANRWGLLAAPWEVRVTAPDSVQFGEEFTVTAGVSYPGPHPFEGLDLVFFAQATIELPMGLQLAPGEDPAKLIPNVLTTGTSDSVSWQVLPYPPQLGQVGIAVRSTGIVLGSSISYPDYQDEIGGAGGCSLTVCNDFGGVRRDPRAVPSSCALRIAGPNPLRIATTLRCDLARAAHLHLAVYDLSGRLVRTLIDCHVPAGQYRAGWDGRDQTGALVAAGIYLARMRPGDEAPLRRQLTVLR
jgi:hypothetical protein